MRAWAAAGAERLVREAVREVEAVASAVVAEEAASAEAAEEVAVAVAGDPIFG